MVLVYTGSRINQSVLSPVLQHLNWVSHAFLFYVLRLVLNPQASFLFLASTNDRYKRRLNRVRYSVGVNPVFFLNKRRKELASS